jgi:16S rRNA (uracil1498-N3)-methyltransferase
VKHRFFLQADQVQGDLVTFSAEQTHQIKSVLRLRAGDTVRVFDGLEPVDHVVVLDGPGAGRVQSTRRQPAEPRTRLVAYPALLQRDKFEPVLQKLTEIGVAAIVPVLTARGLVRETPDDRRTSRWRAILREAAEQSGRGVVPALEAALPLSSAIARASAEGEVLMAYEGEEQLGLRQALLAIDTSSPISLFVGPEGGYTPDEAQSARSAGAQLVTLGPRVLRTETASPVLAALVLHELDSR